VCDLYASLSLIYPLDKYQKSQLPTYLVSCETA
jgi:hypothetical protein